MPANTAKTASVLGLTLAGATIAAVTMLGIVSPPAAHAETRKFNIQGFNGVSVSAGINVIVSEGAFAISASGSEKALERLVIEKKGDTLVIGRKPNSWRMSGRNERIDVTVSAPAYRLIHASSGSDVSAAGLKMQDMDASSSSGASLDLSGTCRSLEASVSSGADFDARGLACGDISVSVSSGSSADLKGSCSSLKVDVSSGASFDGEELKCETATASASSGGGADVWATRAATGNASSGGAIDVYGKPANLEKSTSSGGSVRAL
jgi:hypothetical protein